MDQLKEFLNKQRESGGDVAMPPTGSITSQNAGGEAGDEYTQWPQQFSQRYCHLGAIRTPQGLPAEWAILTWNPQSLDFVKQSSPTATEDLGKLHSVRCSALTAVVDKLRADYKRYTQILSEAQVPAAIRALVVSMDLAIQRLQTVPATEEEIFLAVRNLQQTLLELDAAITYMTVYKKRMESPALTNSTPPAGKLMGAYTGDPPYRPAVGHGRGTILDTPIVTARSPETSLELARHAKHSVICSATNNTDEKVEAIHKVAHSVEWYQDPRGAARPGQKGRVAPERPHPYLDARERPTIRRFIISRVHPAQSPSKAKAKSSRKAPAAEGSKQPQERNKFVALDRPEMPASIPAWERGQGFVDPAWETQSRDPRDKHYVLPEPALLASPENAVTCRLRVYHFTLLKDALLYRLAHPTQRYEPLCSQEWRYVLSAGVCGVLIYQEVGEVPLSLIYRGLQWPSANDISSAEYPLSSAQAPARTHAAPLVGMRLVTFLAPRAVFCRSSFGFPRSVALTALPPISPASQLARLPPCFRLLLAAPNASVRDRAAFFLLPRPLYRAAALRPVTPVPVCASTPSPCLPPILRPPPYPHAVPSARCPYLHVARTVRVLGLCRPYCSARCCTPPAAIIYRAFPAHVPTTPTVASARCAYRYAHCAYHTPAAAPYFFPSLFAARTAHAQPVPLPPRTP
ncbi:hypothetical protein B0H17DRAFT_1224047 [Mycena rosella]|uniref:Uncharacterized protein n=1 Tax=Mycena rosella TaxID=1033263 RepID=A0AAD7H3D1_MYCRO|nr:hypothetical protein B0H17DRAFT_1224047 [Mycena rosella]